MKIVVCIKQVPDTKGGVKFNPDGTLDRGAMLAIMNPDDKAGLEAALRIKEETGAEVTVLTMGLPKAEEVLREAMAMGAAFMVGCGKQVPEDIIQPDRMENILYDYHFKQSDMIPEIVDAEGKTTPCFAAKEAYAGEWGYLKK